MMKRIGMLSLLLCVMVLASAVSTLAEEGLDKIISLDLRDITVRAALEQLFRVAGTAYVIDQNVGEEAMPSVSFHNTSVQTALQSMCRAAGLVYRIDGEVISISKRPQTGVEREPGDRPGQQVLYVQANQQKIGPTLATLFNTANLKYSLPSEAGSIPIDLSLGQVDPYEALQKVIDTAGLTATPAITETLSADTVVELELQDWWTKPVKLDYQNIPMTEVLSKLLNDVGWNRGYSIQPGAANKEMTITAVNIPFFQALRAFAKEAGVSYAISPDKLTIYPANIEDKIVNIEVKDAPLSEVIEMLFEGTSANYSIDPSVSTVKVTAKLKNVDFPTAMKTVVRAAGLVFRVDANTYTISPKTSTSQTMSLPAYAPSGTNPPSLPDSAADPTPTEVVTLKHKDILGDVASLLSKPGRVLVTTVSPDKLVITAPKGLMGEALALAHALDADGTLVRSVKIKLEAKVTAQCLKNPVFLTTESVGAEGSPIPLNVNTQKTIPYEVLTMTVIDGKPVTNKTPQYIQSGGLLEVRLVPTLTEDGRISLSGSGILTYEFVGDQKPIPDQTRFSKNFEVAASIPQGKPTAIATGSISTETYTAAVEITATAVVEEGQVHAPAADSTRPVGGPYPGSGAGYTPGTGGFGGNKGW